MYCSNMRGHRKGQDEQSGKDERPGLYPTPFSEGCTLMVAVSEYTWEELASPSVRLHNVFSIRFMPRILIW